MSEVIYATYYQETNELSCLDSASFAISDFVVFVMSLIHLAYLREFLVHSKTAIVSTGIAIDAWGGNSQLR